MTAWTRGAEGPEYYTENSSTGVHPQLFSVSLLCLRSHAQMNRGMGRLGPLILVRMIPAAGFDNGNLLHQLGWIISF
jgi:hypothetical protein